METRVYTERLRIKLTKSVVNSGNGNFCMCGSASNEEMPLFQSFTYAIFTHEIDVLNWNTDHCDPPRAKSTSLANIVYKHPIYGNTGRAHEHTGFWYIYLGVLMRISYLGVS